MGRILAVDDDADIRDVIAYTLDREHEVTTMHDGHEALLGIRSGRRFDVILCDVHMPRLDGLDLFHQLLEIAPVQARCVVFMSGSDVRPRKQPGTVETPFIPKPFRPDALRALVRELIRTWATQTPANHS